ncbi:MAG: peptide-methionine (S)-S-oxide reductase MsrA [Limnohabitans sp.]|nr:peptide-methionine (S)-S-oxide reductase MsrA [Limnohabitans sp.]
MPDNYAVLNPNTEVAIFAGGCFWCTEAVFLQLEGVKEVKPGYIGGNLENPTYEEICTGKTGHAEAVRIIFDPTKIKYEELLEVFFATHDPTTLNQQGADRGTQYRSEIFVTNEAQKQIAQRYVNQLNKDNVFGKKVVTVVSNAPTFYIAEDYHINYYNRNKNQSYCSYVITPKVEKVKEKYKDKLKK